MIKYDFYRWLRNRKMFMLFFIIVICSLFATLGSYYAKDIIDTLGTTGAEVIVQKMSWQDIIGSYFKTSSQICLFVAVFVISTECQLGRGLSEKLFYQTRINCGGKVLFSKVITGFFINFVAILSAGLLALYVVWSLYSNVDFEQCLWAILVQCVTFCGVTILGNALAVYLTPFFSAVILEIVILFSGIIENLKFFSDWFPLGLLAPNDFLNNFAIKDYYAQFLSLVIVVGVALILIWFKPVREI